LALCACGCGEPTTVITRNDASHGDVKGQSRKFLRGHHLRVTTAPWYKGDGASYRAIHTYLSKHFPKSGICEECGEVKPTDYALIHGREYSRDRADYRELCRRCHVFYDETGYCSYWKKQGLEAAPKGEPPACKCGCGTPVSWDRGRKAWCVYAPGHYRPGERRRAADGSAPPRERKRRRIPREIACAHCGETFTPKRSDAMFCSKACKAAHRRAQGTDNVDLTCHQCGGTFSANRYDGTRHCSQSCAATCQHAGECPSLETDIAA
jgi:hypothetical protein